MTYRIKREKALLKLKEGFDEVKAIREGRAKGLTLQEILNKKSPF